MCEEKNSIKFNNVECLTNVDDEVFLQVSHNNEPVILKNCSFGQCFSRWNLEYLNNKLKDDNIVIHESDCNNLNFLDKNFKYRTCSFNEFSQQLQNKSSLTTKKCVYLRSTNKNPRCKTPARIENDFPKISSDLEPPTFIPFGSDNHLYHSSVLRIASSNLQIWTHFDLYDNILCQVIGTKRIILFSPEDTEYLYIKGDKSLVNNLDSWYECLENFPLLKNTKPYRCVLKPGESLFIPALWWHNIKTVELQDESVMNESYSIGFNIFWKDENLFTENLYADCDVYGNKNLKPVDYAFVNLDKAINQIEKLPGKYKNFYKHLLLERIKTKLFQQ